MEKILTLVWYRIKLEILSISVFQYDGHTALHIASWEGDEMLVKYLYQMKANPNLSDRVGFIETLVKIVL